MWLCAACLLTSCSKDKEIKSPLIGPWESVSLYVKETSTGLPTYEETLVFKTEEEKSFVTFREDGTLKVREYDKVKKIWEEEILKYSESNGKLTIKFDAESSQVSDYEIVDGLLKLYDSETKENYSYNSTHTMKRRD